MLKNLIILLIFILTSSICFAYDPILDSPSTPNSNISWWLDHNARKDYQKYLDYKKKQKDLKKEELLKIMEKDKQKNKKNKFVKP